jgi:hypothetical protein
VTSKGLFLPWQTYLEKYDLVGVEEALDGKVPLFMGNEANDPPHYTSRM